MMFFFSAQNACVRREVSAAKERRGMTAQRCRGAEQARRPFMRRRKTHIIVLPIVMIIGQHFGEYLRGAADGRCGPT